MLEMRTSCEKCGRGVVPDSAAMICVYECTFCVPCTQTMDGICPNCAGELVRRPRPPRTAS
jgi:uncharacterized protein